MAALLRHFGVGIALLTSAIGVVFPPPVSAVECTARVLWGSRQDYIHTGELSASSYASDPAPRHRVGSVDVGIFGIRAYALCENTVQSLDNLQVPLVYGEFTLHNVVFSSSGSASIPVSLNLDLDGRYNFLDGGYALGTMVVEAAIGGTTFPGEIHVCTMYCNQIQTGLLQGVVGRVFPDVRLTTPQAVVPVNQPVSVRISLRLSVASDRLPLSRAEAKFDNTFSFARSGAVFNVPAGVIVNSEQGIIVDNTYQGGNSVPSTPTTWSSIKALYR